MKRHLVTILILICALGLYVAGLALPATALIILGIVTEGIFWFRLLTPGKRQQPKK